MITSLLVMALQDLVGNVDDYEFEIEAFLAKQLGARPMPFPGMDSKFGL